VIERRQLGFFQSLRDGQNGGVHEADVAIRVAMAEITHTLVVRRGEILHLVGAGRDILQKDHEHAGVETFVNPVVHFDQHGGRNDEGLGCAFDELATTQMVRVATFERRVEGSRVENQRHERG
jgi:hypothetical protein